MIAALFSPNQLAAVQRGVTGTMQTPVKILHRTVSTATPNPSTDYGDDVIVYEETNDSEWTTIMGWFISKPVPMQVIDSGAEVAVTTYTLYLPVGTAIGTGDLVEVGDDEYTVSDTSASATWAAFLTVSLRKRIGD